MELSGKVAAVLENAVISAKQHNYEFITPELILKEMCDRVEVIEAFRRCDGDAVRLKEDLSEYLKTYVDTIEKGEPAFSVSCTKMLELAGRSAYNSSNKTIDIRHLIYGIWQLDESYAVYYMRRQQVNATELLRALGEVEEEIADAKDGSDGDEYENVDLSKYNYEDDEDEMGDWGSDELAGSPKGGLQTWKNFAPCLNDTLQNMNPLIGREAELERTIQILCRKDKNNPLHIGEPGVGKTAITYGLVQLIKEEKVPQPLIGSKIFALDLGGMLAGTKYRGDFEKRMKNVLKEISKEEKPILYIDEIHNLSGSGAVGESSFDAANLLKPYLVEGHIRFIGATTFEEYKKYFEKNKSLVRRFQTVEIKEPTEEETLEILKGLRANYEKFHGVVFDKDALEYAVTMSAKHINERYLPDKAIDLIDEAGAYRKLNPMPGKKQVVDKEVISYVLTKICRVPLETVKTDETEGLATLEERMKNEIFGQDEAVEQVVNAVKFSKAGLLEEGKPLASLLFVGPTGVGKTQIARTLAEQLGIKLIRFDMSEYEERHALSKLIGAPAGYVGYEEGGLLTEEIRKSPFCVLLLDEIEKAHADIYNVLLQVMDYATLTDNQGRKADFRNVILIMTSNAGANRIGKKGIGFESIAQNDGVVMEEVKRAFQPEFRNRLNRIVVFHGMDEEMAKQIVDKKLRELGDMLLAKSIDLVVEPSAKEWILKKGVSEEFGAREIDRVIRNEVKPMLVDDILFGKLNKGGTATLSAQNGKFVIKALKRRQKR